MSAGLTLAQVRRLPATVDVETAARAIGIGRSTLYEWIRIGNAPIRTISVRRRHRVITASLVALLEDTGPAGRVLDVIQRLESMEAAAAAGNGNGAGPAPPGPAATT